MNLFDSSSQPVLPKAGQIVPATAALFIQIPTHNGCLQTNMTHQTIDGIPGEEIRGQEDQFQLERNGFTIQHGSPVQRFSRVEEVTKYLRLTERLLKAHLRASRVEVFRHGVQFLPYLGF